MQIEQKRSSFFYSQIPVVNILYIYILAINCYNKYSKKMNSSFCMLRQGKYHLPQTLPLSKSILKYFEKERYYAHIT